MALHCGVVMDIAPATECMKVLAIMALGVKEKVTSSCDMLAEG